MSGDQATRSSLPIVRATAAILGVAVVLFIAWFVMRDRRVHLLEDLCDTLQLEVVDKSANSNSVTFTVKQSKADQAVTDALTQDILAGKISSISSGGKVLTLNSASMPEPGKASATYSWGGGATSKGIVVFYGSPEEIQLVSATAW